MKHIKGLDTLRAFAVTMVVINHWAPVRSTGSPAMRFIRTFFIPDGTFGVNLFFVLSGFLITSILLDAGKRASTRDRLQIIRLFFVRRILRIFPIYYLLLLLLYVVNMGDVRANIWHYLTYTINMIYYKTGQFSAISYIWTLAIEEQFYLLWPWLMIFVNPRYLKYVLAGAIVTGIASTFITMGIYDHKLPLLVINCFDAFGIGGLYAFIRLRSNLCKQFELTLKAVVFAPLAMYGYWKFAEYAHQPQYGIFLYKTVESIISLWLIVLVINNASTAINRYVLENKVFNFIGKISYGLYLYHIPVMLLASASVKTQLSIVALKYPAYYTTITGSTCLYITLTILLLVITLLSYYLVERPLLKMKQLFRINETR